MFVKYLFESARYRYHTHSLNFRILLKTPADWKKLFPSRIGNNNLGWIVCKFIQSHLKSTTPISGLTSADFVHIFLVCILFVFSCRLSWDALRQPRMWRPRWPSLATWCTCPAVSRPSSPCPSRSTDHFFYITCQMLRMRRTLLCPHASLQAGVQFAARFLRWPRVTLAYYRWRSEVEGPCVLGDNFFIFSRHFCDTFR